MQNNEILYTEADINNVKRRRLAIDIPDELLDKDETDYLDEDMEEDYETFRSLKEATHQGGYIDISKEVNSGYSYPSKSNDLFFDLSKTDDPAKDIVQMVTKSEEEKKKERKKEWGKLLSAMNTYEDEYAVCSNLSGQVLFDVLMETMKNIDEVYTKFTQNPDRHPRHVSLLEEIMNDLKEEEKIIEEYKEELKKLD